MSVLNPNDANQALEKALTSVGLPINPSQAALIALPVITQAALLQSRRVVLIANNPSIITATLDALLQPTDTLVLFNHFIHAEYFATHPLASTLAKLLFFRQIGDSTLHFGLPPRHNNLPSIEQMAIAAPLGFLFSNIPYQFPTLQDDPSPDDDPIDDKVLLTISETLQLLLRDRHYSRTLSDPHPVVADYPHFEAIHSSAPSSGFLLYRLMVAVRHYLAAHYQHDLEIVLVGFNHDRKTNHFWHGHNWVFERNELATPTAGITIITQD